MIEKTTEVMRISYRGPGSSANRALSPEQHAAVELVKYRMCEVFIAESEALYRQHPELRLEWGFECRATVRAEDTGGKF